MLYGKKPNLSQLKEWGEKVWIHILGGTKLDGQSKRGKWIGVDKVSNGHQIFWPDKHSVTIERSIKFDNGDVIFPPISVTRPIQGEKEQRKMNQQHDKEPIKQRELTIKETPRSSLDTNQDNNQGNVDNNQYNNLENIKNDSDKNQWLGVPFN